jgi:hypothetical protein
MRIDFRRYWECGVEVMAILIIIVWRKEFASGAERMLCREWLNQILQPLCSTDTQPPETVLATSNTTVR